MASRNGKYLGQVYQQWRIITSPYVNKSKFLLARYQMQSNEMIKLLQLKTLQNLINSLQNRSRTIVQNICRRPYVRNILHLHKSPHLRSLESINSNTKIYLRLVDNRLQLLKKNYEHIESSILIKGRRAMEVSFVRRMADGLKIIQKNHLYLKGRSILRNSRYPITYCILAINSGIFLLWQVSGPKLVNPYTGKVENQSLLSSKFMWRHFTTNWNDIKNGRWHTIVTTNFSHNKFGHFFFNMFALYFFGMTFESFFGPSAFLVSYMISGIFASLVQSGYLKTNGQPFTPILGASGAVNGLLVMVALKAPFLTVYLYGILPFPLVAVVGGIFCFELFASGRIQDTTAHEGHLAGMFSGALLYFLKYR